MKEEFNNWWNSDELLKDNPYRIYTPAYWAWEGWCAAVKAEREACAAIARQWDVDHPASNYGGCIANLIEARGK
jgi:hypothetical protein